MNESTLSTEKPELISQEEKTTSMWIHVLPLLGAFFNVVVSFPYLGLLIAIFLYTNHREKGEFVIKNARESLNFQITLSVIWTLLLAFFFIAFAPTIFDLFNGKQEIGEALQGIHWLGVALPGIIIGIGLWVLALVQMILASVSSSRGKCFRYLTFRPVKA